MAQIPAAMAQPETDYDELERGGADAMELLQEIASAYSEALDAKVELLTGLRPVPCGCRRPDRCNQCVEGERYVRAEDDPIGLRITARSSEFQQVEQALHRLSRYSVLTWNTHYDDCLAEDGIYQVRYELRLPGKDSCQV